MAAAAAAAAAAGAVNVAFGAVLDDAGIGAPPTDDQRAAFNLALNPIPEHHKPTWSEASKIRRAFERESISSLIDNDMWKKTSPPKFLAAFLTFPNPNAVLNYAQINALTLDVYGWLTGDINNHEAVGITKKELFPLWYGAINEILAGSAGAGAGAGAVYRDRLILVLTMELKFEVRTRISNLRMEASFKRRLQSMEDKMTEREAKLRKLEEKHENQERNKERAKDKVYVCLSWVKGACKNGDKCAESHRASLQTLQYLNKAFKLDVSEEELKNRAGSA